MTSNRSNGKGNRKGPRAVGSLLPLVTGRVLAKKGFPSMSLITDWAAIVGPALSGCTCPEKLNWPRQPRDQMMEDGDSTAQSGSYRSEKRQRGITLRLRVESHMALDVQYQTAEIIERINTYFGYRAVTDIRLIQGPVGKGDITARTGHDDHVMCKSTRPLADLSSIRDEGLRKALERLDQARRG